MSVVVGATGWGATFGVSIVLVVLGTILGSTRTTLVVGGAILLGLSFTVFRASPPMCERTEMRANDSCRVGGARRPHDEMVRVSEHGHLGIQILGAITLGGGIAWTIAGAGRSRNDRPQRAQERTPPQTSGALASNPMHPNVPTYRER